MLYQLFRAWGGCLGYDALSLDIWFPKVQGKADISASKSEMFLSPPIISYSLCCRLLSAIPDWLLNFIISQSPITPSLYIHVVTCLVFFLDISTHEDETLQCVKTSVMQHNIPEGCIPHPQHSKKAKNLHTP